MSERALFTQTTEPVENFSNSALLFVGSVCAPPGVRNLEIQKENRVTLPKGIDCQGVDVTAFRTRRIIVVAKMDNLSTQLAQNYDPFVFDPRIIGYGLHSTGVFVGLRIARALGAAKIAVPFPALSDIRWRELLSERCLSILDDDMSSTDWITQMLQEGIENYLKYFADPHMELIAVLPPLNVLSQIESDLRKGAVS